MSLIRRLGNSSINYSFLKYAKPMLQIISLTKMNLLKEQEYGKFDEETRLINVQVLDDWALKCPLYYQMRASESLYTERGYNMLNEIFVMAKLQILKPGVLAALSSENPGDSRIITVLVQNLDIVGKLAKAFLAQEIESDPSLVFLHRLFFIGSLMKILIGLTTGSEFREQVYELTCAMNKIFPSPESEIVLYCTTDKARCIEILQLA